jgi:predicted oxidoreductase
MPTPGLPDTYFACRLGYGCMRIAGDAAKGRAAVLAAYEAGYTLFDHADIYGGGACEELFGKILKDTPGMREHIVLQSKVGIRPRNADAPTRYDFSREHLTTAVEGCMRRLGVDHLDMLLLHRIDLLANGEEVASVIDELHAAGKVGHFGVSNASPSQVRMFAAHWRVPIVANQIEVNLDRIDSLTDGALDQCQEMHISPQAWCPIGGVGYGAWGRNATPAQWRLVEIELDRQAAALGTDRVGVNLAWLLKHPSRMVPLIGSTTPARITSALKAVDLAYSREDWYRLHEARRGQAMP